ncbi:MAG: peptidase, partial [Bacteroidetes bacterium HGW-Bacteroidetes-15]
MKQKQLIIVIGVVALIFLLIFSSRTFYIIQPGERGIIFRPFTSGLDKANIKHPGFHIIAPWNDLHVYDVKEQKAEETMDVLDKSGLKVIIDVSIRFNPIYDQIGSLHEVFGKAYINQLVIPE